MLKAKRGGEEDEWLEVLPDATCRSVRGQKEYIPFSSLVKTNILMTNVPINTKRNDVKAKCESGWCQVRAEEEKLLQMEEVKNIMIKALL